MRKRFAGSAVCAAAIMIGSAACAGGNDIVVSQPAALPPPLDSNGEVVPVVAPGDEIAIACAGLSVKQNSDVRVVLTISAAPSADTLGYRKILATEEERTEGSIRVRIPSAPDIEDHTVDLGIYVVDSAGSQYCEGGHLKIEAALKHPKSQKS